MLAALFGILSWAQTAVPEPPTNLTAAVSSVGPTFSDDFSAGILDTTKWSVSTWPVIIGGSTTTFYATHIDLSGGSLRMMLTQPTPTTSLGAEIISKRTFLYGIFEWTMRASSTATTATQPGVAVSGQISTGYTYTSTSELDVPEIEGRTPTVAEFTNWLNGHNSGAAIYNCPFKPQDGFHRYKVEWRPTYINYYVDDVLISTHTDNIPSTPAPVIMDTYGTNNASWGGLASVGITRYEYFSSFKYWP